MNVALFILALLAAGDDSSERRAAAAKLLSEAYAETSALPEYSQVFFFDPIANEQMEIGELDAGLKTAAAAGPFSSNAVCTFGKKLKGKTSEEINQSLRKIDKKIGTHSALYCLADSLLDDGDIEAARRWASQIDAEEVKRSLEEKIESIIAKKTGKLPPTMMASSSPDKKFYLALEARDFSLANALAGSDPVRLFSLYLEQASDAVEKKDLAAARKAFKLAESSGREKDEKLRDGTRYFIAAYEAKAGLFDDAIETANSIKDPYSAPKAKASIAAFLSQKGEFERALALSQTISAQKPTEEYDPSASYQEQAWQFIAREQTNAGKPEEALKTLSLIHGRFSEMGGGAALERVYALSSKGDFEAARAQLPKDDRPSLTDDRGAAFKLFGAAFCKKHSASECRAMTRNGFSPQQRVAVLIGAAQGLVRDTKLENSVPIWVH
jgi:hypothetical protein